MEEKNVSGPRQLWNQALRVVKGDSTQELVERFTSEMTLVAEGLADDQSRLHRELERLESQQEKSGVQLSNAQEEQARRLQSRLDEQEQAIEALRLEERRLSDSVKGMEKRLFAL